MLSPRFLLHGICLLVLVSIAVATCGLAQPLVYQAVKGSAMTESHIVFTIAAPNATAVFTARPISGTWTLPFVRLFAIQKSGGVLKLVIVQPEQLRALLHQYGTNICGLGLYFSITCYDGPQRYTRKFTRYLYIRPDNNVLRVDPLTANLNVREDTIPATWTSSLSSVILTPASSVAHYQFIANVYNQRLVDARWIFAVNKNGTIRLLTHVDWETRSLGYYLNVTLSISLFVCKGQATVEAGPVRSLTGILSIKIVNVNDNSPKFIKPTCPPLCGPPNYYTDAASTFWGQISNINDGPIAASDRDGDEIRFSISGGSPSTYNQYFTIKPFLGIVWATQPLGNAHVSFFNLTIQAQSFSVLPPTVLSPPNQRAFAFFIVNVRENVNQPSALLSNCFPRQPCIIGIIVMIAVVLLV